MCLYVLCLKFGEMEEESNSLIFIWLRSLYYMYRCLEFRGKQWWRAMQSVHHPVPVLWSLNFLVQEWRNGHRRGEPAGTSLPPPHTPPRPAHWSGVTGQKLWPAEWERQWLLGRPAAAAEGAVDGAPPPLLPLLLLPTRNKRLNCMRCGTPMLSWWHCGRHCT